MRPKDKNSESHLGEGFRIVGSSYYRSLLLLHGHQHRKLTVNFFSIKKCKHKVESIFQHLKRHISKKIQSGNKFSDGSNLEEPV